MQIHERGVIFDASKGSFRERVSFFTGLCTLSDGSILAVFQVGSKKQSPDSTLRICRSDDHGRTWRLLATQFETTFAGIPGSFSSPSLVEAQPGRWLLFATWFDRSDPDRPLFDPVTEGILHSRLLVAESLDEGTSWNSWRELSTCDLRGCAMTGPVLKLPDNTLVCAFESFKEFDDHRTGRHAAWVMRSRDQGTTFLAPQQVAQHPEHKLYYWDQRLCTGSVTGDVVALFWTHDLEQKQDRRVHLRRFRIEENELNTDSIFETPIPGQIAAPLSLADRRLLAFVVDRSQPSTMSLWSSQDLGTTWPERDRLIVYTHDERAAISQGRENIDFKQYWEDMGKWSFGHPALVPLDENRVLLAWYAGTPDCMSIHWATVKV